MTADPDALLSIRGLTKRFLGTLALDHVDLTIGRGEIHALVGENGAGKSTLIKILAGIHEPDEGDILIDGLPVHPHGSSVPISFVHQDLGLVDELSIGENVALVAGFPRRWGMISWRRVWTQAEEIYERMGVEPPHPCAEVSTLSAADKAVLGIVRALSQKGRMVVLDEPTAALPGPDAEHLFDILRALKRTGTSVLYVSHRLNELFGLVDRVTVLRDGRRIGTTAIAELTPDLIVRDMLGHELQLAPHDGAAVAAERRLLEVSNLETGEGGDDRPVSFSLAPGEIVGLVGLRGAGHEAIGRMIFGAEPHRGGEIRLDGEALPPSLPIAGRIARGIALLAGDRLRESALGGMSVRENLIPNAAAGSGALFRPILREQEARTVEDVLERFDVRPRNPGALIDWLSGGNQQKVFVGRWLVTGAKLYIMEEPTAGVDIGAKETIHSILRGLAEEGAAVLVVSSDFEEIASLCDRALVIGRGAITAELRGTSLTVSDLVARASLGPQPAPHVN